MRKYKIHAMVFAVALALSTVSIVIGLYAGLLQHEKQISFLKGLPFEYCYQFDGDNYVSNSFVDLNASYSLKAENAIKCDKLMQVSPEYATDCVWGKIPMLQANEVYLSSNLLALHDLAIGDVVYVQSPNSAQPAQYYVAGAFEEYYGVYDEFVDTNKGVVIFGLDEDYLAHNESGFITYQGIEFKASNTNSQLTGVISLKKQQSSIWKDFLQIAAIIWCIQIVSDAMGCFFLFFRYRNYLKKLRCSGMDSKGTAKKILYTITGPLYACRVLFLVVGAIMLIAVNEYAIVTISLIELLVLTVITMIQKILIGRSA